MRVLCVENSAILKRTTRVLFVSRPFSLSLSLSLSLESKANTKVVSKLSCERVFMEKRTDGFPQRERERERVFAHEHVRKSTTTRDSTACTLLCSSKRASSA